MNSGVKHLNYIEAHALYIKLFKTFICEVFFNSDAKRWQINVVAKKPPKTKGDPTVQ